MEIIIGQALLDKNGMERLIHTARALTFSKVMPFQSSQSARPGVDGVPTLTQLLKDFDGTFVKLILWGGEKERRLRDVLWEPSFGTSIRALPGVGLDKLVVLFGPEEDFTAGEIEQAKAADYVVVGWGGLDLSADQRAFYAMASIHSLLC